MYRHSVVVLARSAALLAQIIAQHKPTYNRTHSIFAALPSVGSTSPTNGGGSGGEGGRERSPFTKLKSVLFQDEADAVLKLTEVVREYEWNRLCT